jgi:hypothetical protein
VAARLGTPVLGVQGGGYPAAGTWVLSFGWRNQTSDKHYVGDVYQPQRIEEGSEVINHINLADITVRYQATKRTELSMGAPYFMGTRSQALRNSQQVLIERYKTQARGLGDVFFTARRWMLDPDKHGGGNVLLGLGVKIPTGENNVVDNFRVFSPTPAPNGSVSNVLRTVDQSIQPGDGGFGVLADMSAFKSLANGKASLYLSAAYLSNPQGLSGVRTYRSAPGEEVMSIADQYSVRGGISVAVPKITNLSFSAGVRWEGVPVRDLIGPSEGFRRPGYAVDIEPSLMYVHGKSAFSLGVPFAIYRNRLVSVADEANGTHGDAAFADYLILVGYSRRF